MTFQDAKAWVLCNIFQFPEPNFPQVLANLAFFLQEPSMAQLDWMYTHLTTLSNPDFMHNLPFCTQTHLPWFYSIPSLFSVQFPWLLRSSGILSGRNIPGVCCCYLPEFSLICFRTARHGGGDTSGYIWLTPPVSPIQIFFAADLFQLQQIYSRRWPLVISWFSAHDRELPLDLDRHVSSSLRD